MAKATFWSVTDTGGRSNGRGRGGAEVTGLGIPW